jgi:uronate dehydrogenase/NAD+ dependent glucose-6-phosphate dehydrogenase
VWCSQRDATDLVDRCIEAPDSLAFDIFFGVSDNKYSYRDVSHAREVLGFQAKDRAEDYR